VFLYTHWCSGQPDDSLGAENCLEINYSCKNTVWFFLYIFSYNLQSYNFTPYSNMKLLILDFTKCFKLNILFYFDSNNTIMIKITLFHLTANRCWNDAPCSALLSSICVKDLWDCHPAPRLLWFNYIFPILSFKKCYSEIKYLLNFILFSIYVLWNTPQINKRIVHCGQSNSCM